MPGILLDRLRGKPTDKVPMWLMRQAGRYLPEYRQLRASKGGFLDLVFDSEAAAEVTLQPIRRFGFDGAILFSDILIVPLALGQKVEFLAGEGPRLSPRLLDDLSVELNRDADAHATVFAPIYRTLQLVRQSLGERVTLLGFAGSPWTVATYMVAGSGSRDQAETRQLAYRDPQRFDAIIDAITLATIAYLRGQIDAGAEAVQLFDSWAGSLAPAQFERFVIAPNARILEALRQSHPDCPVIGFPKGAGEKLCAYARETGVNALALDETVDPEWAARELPDNLPIQGNLDPLALLVGGEQLERACMHILDCFEGRAHIFNLGHGISQHTPLEHVERLVEIVRSR